MTVALLILTLNEVEGMKIVMPQVNHTIFDEILVVDGGSNDGTIQYALDQGYQVHIQERKGLRHAYNEGVNLLESDYIIPFSPDGNSLPSKLDELVLLADGVSDMVTCSRYLPPARSYDDNLATTVGNQFFTSVINYLHCGKYTDSLVMYRLIKRSVFFDLGLFNDAPYRYPELFLRTTLCLMPLLSIRAARKGIVFSEIPGDEPCRIGGEKKLKTVRWGLGYLYQVVLEYFYKFEKKI